MISKLSIFLQTNRLATSYIDYLMQLLNSENVGSNAISGFKADIHKRWKEKSEDQKRRELVSISSNILHSIVENIIKNICSP